MGCGCTEAKAMSDKTVQDTSKSIEVRDPNGGPTRVLRKSYEDRRAREAEDAKKAKTQLNPSVRDTSVTRKGAAETPESKVTPAPSVSAPGAAGAKGAATTTAGRKK